MSGPVEDVTVQRAPSGPVGPPTPAQPDPSPARTRGGLGAPLDALPPTAAVPGGTAPLLGGRGPVQRIAAPATDGAVPS
ncbi:hypothetical protein AB0E96_41210, partial [Kitasatospora sp. NPDC036755]